MFSNGDGSERISTALAGGVGKMQTDGLRTRHMGKMRAVCADHWVKMQTKMRTEK